MVLECIAGHHFCTGTFVGFEIGCDVPVLVWVAAMEAGAV